ncbi:MAG: hypothetical protein ACJ8AO_02165 [Gemmatimonadaceae bacterium]|jgi:hypothetical protein
MARRGRQVGVGESALKGAIAGAVGGLAMIAAEELAERRLLSRTGRARDEWGTLAADVGDRAGIRLRGRTRTAAGAGLHVLVSAALGAAYGLAMSQGRLKTPLKGLVESALVYGAYLAERPGPLTHGNKGRRLRAMRKGRLPVSAHDLFGAATSQVFSRLLKV